VLSPEVDVHIRQPRHDVTTADIHHVGASSGGSFVTVGLTEAILPYRITTVWSRSIVGPPSMVRTLACTSASGT
jgi:hypothetical protein